VGKGKLGDVPGFESTVPCQMQMVARQSVTETAFVEEELVRGLILMGF
jgi:hypothetical protein